MSSTSINRKVAVVTGGGRGIGKAIALSLAERGANVVICSRTSKELNKVSELIESNGGKCMVVTVDISIAEQVDHLVREVMKKHGTIDIFINNAGIGVYKALIDSSLEDWDSVINTNLKGAFLCSRAIAGIMAKQKKGLIINIASGAAKKGMKNLSIYCASKFGLLGLTQSMKKELREFGVEVLYVCPGYVNTSFFKNFPTDFVLPAHSAQPEQIAETVVKKIALHYKLKAYRKELADRFYRIIRYNECLF